MPDASQFNTPILMITFNRPDETKKLFDQIRMTRPTHLYVANDGPRNQNDLAAINEIREEIIKPDWPCELHTFYADANQGCKLGVSNAISWFFEDVEAGIILEDDCIPNVDFFAFCEAMLDRYRHDRRISMITGTNHLSDNLNYPPYFFSEHFNIWGWATWRRAWELYDIEMKNWPSKAAIDFLEYKYPKKVKKHFEFTFNQAQHINTWDIQWVFTCIMNHTLCITPRANLISNIGVQGVHAGGKTDAHFMPTYRFPNECYASYYPDVTLHASFDLDLHKLKSYKAQRYRDLVTLMRRLRIYEFLRKMKRKLYG